MATGAGDVVAMSVHGPSGVVDLVVPSLATAADVAQEYAEQAGLAAPPMLTTTTGRTLDPARPLLDLGLRSGSLLVVVDDLRPAASDRPALEPVRAEGPWASALLVVASAGALLAGWVAASTDGDTHRIVVGLLVLGTLVALLPMGVLAERRALVAPAYAGAAAYAAVGDPAPERLPTSLGVAVLVSAVAAGVGRSLCPHGSELLRVWIVVGVSFFLVTMGGALVGAPAQLVWAVLVALAMLAPRFVPGFAVDVPDPLLIDLDRLAVNAWSARERPTGRGRTVVPPDAVAAVAARGARTVTAASAGVLAVLLVSAPALVAAVEEPVDVVGARLQVLFSGAAVLLAARSYRHRLARALLRLAGLACWVGLLVDLAAVLREGTGLAVVVSAVVVGVLVVLAAVATGRGWRSAWWSRRAEVLEGLTGALALASMVVSTGLFRLLWENIPDV